VREFSCTVLVKVQKYEKVFGMCENCTFGVLVKCHLNSQNLLE
jgi:hypothetical protein